ncbi:MAG: YceD family protein [Kiritimatiellaeota bacterium]|nr:YceD family protein [Kiritimatiellota bacterium]
MSGPPHNPMILNLTKLTPSATRFTGEDPVSSLEWEGSETDSVRPASPLRWDFTARLFDTELLIDGSASADFEGVCARCGKAVKFTIREPLSFSTAVDSVSLTVDLTPEIREAILLALPSNPLCRDDCPGLCPRCGKPLADGTCTCESATENNPFAGIKI